MLQQQRVGIIGVGYEGFRPVVSDLSTRELMFEAASKAYEDASIDPRREVGSFVCCTEDLWEGWSITDEMVPDQIAAAGRPLCTIPADAVTGLGTVVMHLLSGIADVVGPGGAQQGSGRPRQGRRRRPSGQEPSLVRPLGMSSDALAALEMGAFLRARRSRHAGGGRIIIDAKEEAMRNPRASFSGSFSESEIAASKVLSTPLRKVDKADFAEAGIVLVLASESWMRKNKRDAVYVDGVAWSSSLPWFDGGDVSLAELRGGTHSTMRPERAGVKPWLENFDILELDDTYSYKLLQHLHSMAKSRAEEERVLSGEGPALNPSGGSLGVGNLLEASALHRLLEVRPPAPGRGGRHTGQGCEERPRPVLERGADGDRRGRDTLAVRR